MNLRPSLFFGTAILAAFIIAQTPPPTPKAAKGTDFADASKKVAPEAPSHLFAHGECSSVFLAAPSKPIPAHYHAVHDETVVILRGKGKMRLGSDERDIQAGDVVFIPKGTIHDFRPDGKDAVAVSTFAPHFDGKDRIFVDRQY